MTRMIKLEPWKSTEYQQWEKYDFVSAGAEGASLQSRTEILEILHPGGSVAEWFRALDLKSGGPCFKSSTLPLAGFVLGSPKFNSSATVCKIANWSASNLTS